MTFVILNRLSWFRATFLTVLLLLCFTSVAWADDIEQDKPNPLELELTEPDPLLPKLPVERPLTESEREKVRLALDELDKQALAQLEAGNVPAAFEIWYREIRLRRKIGGPIEEVQALGRVGEIAWQDNRKPQLQLILARLETIEQEAETEGNLDLPLLVALGQAYGKIRVPGQALIVYEKVLAQARTREDAEAIEATLQTMASLHMAWFDYPKAAAAYEELLDIAQLQGDSLKEFNYLKELAYIYDQAKEPENALRYKQKILETYLPEDPRRPELKIAIASDYETLGQLDEASKTYQEAYTLAFSLKQFAYAADALRKLASLYSSHQQPEFALQVYETLLEVEQFSYNYYGLMYAYDQIGQINLQLKDYGKALVAFEKGLELAQSLKYQESYFVTQIEQVKQQNVQ
ncbi:MAG: hypothetical protein WA919_19470 [Coleofasciculaceae cyanobacterium]